MVEPRKRWPSGTVHQGAIPGLRAGRAVAFADDPGWDDALDALRRSGYRTIPDELLDGAITALKRWSSSWGDRPTWVMPAPAFGTAAEANRVLAEHEATVGKRPLVEPLRWVGPEAPRNAPSRPMVEHLDASIVWNDGVVVPDGPVFLCSVSTRSRWTAAVVARLLDEAGHGPVLPFTIHLQP